VVKELEGSFSFPCSLNLQLIDCFSLTGCGISLMNLWDEEASPSMKCCNMYVVTSNFECFLEVVD